MKVNIGPYINYIGPCQIAELVLFWLKKNDDGEQHPVVERFGNWLAGDQDKKNWLVRFCSWIHSHRRRRVKIKLDPWDSWSADTTLVMITLPLLRQLHKNKHGAPNVDDWDVPEHVRSSSAKDVKNDPWQIDSNHFVRWDWVMDEIIWAFEQLQPDSDWEEQYQVNGVYDIEGSTAHAERIQNALKLFGKYYQALWD